MSELLEFFKRKKETFVKPMVTRENYLPSYMDEDTGTYWPSQWDEVQVDEFDWEAFEESVLEFEKSFCKDGQNAWRNPLNKES